MSCTGSSYLPVQQGSPERYHKEPERLLLKGKQHPTQVTHNIPYPVAYMLLQVLVWDMLDFWVTLAEQRLLIMWREDEVVSAALTIFTSNWFQPRTKSSCRQINNGLVEMFYGAGCFLLCSDTLKCKLRERRSNFVLLLIIVAEVTFTKNTPASFKWGCLQ